MASRDIDAILPEVMTHAPRAPEPLMLRNIRDAARRICMAGRMWRENDTLDVATPEAEALCTIPDAEIIEIERAKLDDIELTPRTIAWLDDNRPGWEDDDADAGSARFITQKNLNSVTVVPPATGTLTVRFILKPSRTALTLPAFLVDQFGEELGKGAAAKILQTPGEFANPQLGLKLESDFERLVNGLKFRVAKGQQGARLRTKGSYL
ncbi:hypothetical protein [Allomesorhizobium alhagi]|uniref:Uncharacterized protein n=1 Tax=Mesorhizobium alhagi CCNWXJ12-2 TaxID=1107882 RepID=H0HNI3_9HYPH|nr:hypothetical protein [Mesorhizobium alhagi]EHK57636.1 hypothetical protein MAXJ12_08529 [Mesorhizobium alhagi CCNWXJ12-2]